MGPKGKAMTMGPGATSFPNAKLDNNFCTILRGRWVEGVQKSLHRKFSLFDKIAPCVVHVK